MKRWLQVVTKETLGQNTTHWADITQISSTVFVNNTDLSAPDELREVTNGKLIVRKEEIVIVSIVLFLWMSIIVLFVNKWGKIRMLEPYLPLYKLDNISSPSEELPSRVSISIDPTCVSRRQSGNPVQQYTMMDVTRRLSELSFASSKMLGGRRKSEILPSKSSTNPQNMTHSHFSSRRKSDFGWSNISTVDEFVTQSNAKAEVHSSSGSIWKDRMRQDTMTGSETDDALGESCDIFCINDAKESCSFDSVKPELKAKAKTKLYKRRGSEFPIGTHHKYNRRQSEVCAQIVNKLSRRQSEAHFKPFPSPKPLAETGRASSNCMFSSAVYLNRMSSAGAGRFGRVRQNSAIPGSCHFQPAIAEVVSKRTKSVDNLRVTPKNSRTTEV